MQQSVRETLSGRDNWAQKSEPRLLEKGQTQEGSVWSFRKIDALEKLENYFLATWVEGGVLFADGGEKIGGRRCRQVCY